LRPNNRPQKGSTIKVEPIREPKDIRLIKKLLADRPRDLAIFTLGINTNLRASDLLPITVDQVRHLKAGDHFTIREMKTGKLRDVTVNKNVQEAMQALLASMPDAGGGEFLFQSRKGRQALTVSYLNALVKAWCREVNLKGNFGSHTLRKTLGAINQTSLKSHRNPG
jgi:integrase